jgi:hypothetical protein
MRDLLAWTWCAGALAAGFRGGLSALTVFGLPLAIVGYQAIARSKDWRWPGWRIVASRFWPVLACGGLLAVVRLKGVRPLDSASSAALAGGALWSLALAASPRRIWRWLAPAPLAGFAYLLACASWPQSIERFVRGVPGSVLLQDVRGGRDGVRLFGDFSYSWPGPNTALIERSLGAVEPEWEGRWYSSRGYAGMDERVNRRSIIREANLPEILAMLPSDEARRQALECVTTPKNLARVHQGLLLVSLKTLGYPAGHDAESWWRRHAAVYRIVEDGDEASQLVLGWRQAIEHCLAEADARSPRAPLYAVRQQLDAALNQEFGTWGGDDEFSEAYYLASAAQRSSRVAAQDRSPPRDAPVTWWKESPPITGAVSGEPSPPATAEPADR